MTMVNPDSLLEAAAARYADLIIRSLDPDVGLKPRRREPAPVTARPIRLTAAVLLRRLADAIQSEPALADPLVLTR